MNRVAGRWIALSGLGVVLLACTATTSVEPGEPGTPPGSACASNEQCSSGVCTDGVCQPPVDTDGGKKAAHEDGIKNNSETDVDCGGPGAEVPRCATGKMCEEGADCANKICTEKRCAAPTPTDGVQNGDESDVDCGGAAAPKCGPGKGCKSGPDCTTGTCKNNKCISPGAADGVKNGTETDIDCGGDDPGTPRCATGKSCLEGPDCESVVCDPNTNKCKAPSPTDGVKNGKETDIDCGGGEVGTPKCGAGKSCVAHGDCTSNGCAYDNKCATAASCTKIDGGYTCGPIDMDGRQDDCCVSAAVGGYTVDKYLITAGRMRAFLDRFNGNVRAYAQNLPANVWSQQYTSELPTTYDEANEQLGPLYDKRACQTGDRTGHVFWTPPSASDRIDFPKDVRDRKALNCVPWWLMSAFCIWDGGHLATEAEIRAAYTNAETTAYPWGAIGTYTTTSQNAYAVQVFGYATPNPGAAKFDGIGYFDIAYYIAPPGRRPTGYNASGHADMVGNLLEWVGDRDRQFIWKGSFENHANEADMRTPAANDPYLARNGTAPWQWGYNIGTGRPGDGRGVGYYGIGGRCAR